MSLDYIILEEDLTHDGLNDRLTDDPVLLSEAGDILQVLSPRQRKILFGRTIGGRTCREMGKRRRRSGERVRQPYRGIEKTLLESYMLADIVDRQNV